jgi:hypothetical protein
VCDWDDEEHGGTTRSAVSRTWGHAEDKDSRLPFSWVSDHEIEPDAVDGTCTGCGGRIALVWTEAWDCGCVFAVAEGALVRPCQAHAAEDDPLEA